MTPSATKPDSMDPAARAWRRVLFSWPVLGLLLLLLLSSLAWKGSRLYLRHRDRMLMLAATHAIDTRDFPSARVWLQRLYLAHPDEIAVSRLIARYDAEQRLPEELAWRARVVQIGLATLDDYLAWVAVALRLGQNGVALAALDHIPSAWRGNAAYHVLYAQALAADGRVQAADDHLVAAATLDPANPVPMVRLATLRLTGESGGRRDSARAVLERLAAVAVPPVSALRALLDDAIRQHDPVRIARFRSALRARPDRSLDDELACIGAAPSPAAAQADLVSLWRTVRDKPAQALQVAEWMLRQGEARDALDWLRKLPGQSDIAIQTGEADALTGFAGLARAALVPHGQELAGLRLSPHCPFGAVRPRDAQPRPAWTEAVAACAGDGSNLRLLAQTAASWSWRSEAEALYWKITGLDYAYRGPALKALWNLYSAASNTAGLLVVSHAQFDDAPKDPGIRNNFAFLSLLSGIGISKAGELAKEDFLSQPENPHVAATYAYALYLQGNYQEGLHVLGRFDAHRVQAAGAALYLALLQQAAGQKRSRLPFRRACRPGKAPPRGTAAPAENQFLKRLTYSASEHPLARVNDPSYSAPVAMGH